MADETQLVKKRLRIDEDGETTATTFKRQKSYDVVEEGSDDSEPKPTQELSSFMTTTLQRELSDDAAASPAPGNDDVSDSILRHLLEASDDELGLLPTKSEETGDHDLVILEDCSIDVEGVAMEGSIDVGGGGQLWEIEDEAANYYALMQPQLFL